MKKIICIVLTLLCITTLFTQNIKAEEIDLYSEYAIIINIKDDRVVYSKNMYEKMYPASMTKMMSVLVAIEHIEDMQTTFTFTEEVLEGLEEEEASVAGFEVGDVVTYEDLLYGIMLPSGADASRAIAFSLFGSEEAFVKKMNAKAKVLAMKDTHFVNTSGLHDENHYSTVYDLAVLLKYALENETFKKIFTTHTYTTSDEKLTFISTFYRQKEEVEQDVSMILGTKTGFTYPASLCLASYAEVDEEAYIAITGKTKSWDDAPFHILDHAKLYNYFYKNYHRTLILEKGEAIVKIPIRHGFDTHLVVASKHDIDVICKGKDNVEIVFDGVEYIEAPMKVGTCLGELRLIEDGKEIYKEKIYLQKTISTNYISYYMAYPAVFVKHLIVLLANCAIAYYAIKKGFIKLNKQ